jgi:heme/copper-type cytochrome/quinol oxidase subunit 4
MRTSVAFGVWAFMVLSVLTEVGTYYRFTGTPTLTAVVGLLASSQAAAIMLFFMNLKDEPGSLKLFALVPVLFLSGLLIAMIASLG